MPYVTIDYTDGVYSIRELTDASADAGMQQGREFVNVDKDVIKAWHRYLDDGAAWNALWRALDEREVARLHAREQDDAIHASKREIARLEALIAQFKEAHK